MNYLEKRQNHWEQQRNLIDQNIKKEEEPYLEQERRLRKQQQNSTETQ